MYMLPIPPHTLHMLAKLLVFSNTARTPPFIVTGYKALLGIVCDISRQLSKKRSFLAQRWKGLELFQCWTLTGGSNGKNDFWLMAASLPGIELSLICFIHYLSLPTLYSLPWRPCPIFVHIEWWGLFPFRQCSDIKTVKVFPCSSNYW